MVHKKYTYKDGKRFGPYFYETKRVDGKVITTYLGTDIPKTKKSLIMALLIFSILSLVLLLLYFSSFNITGNASLDMKTNYKFGESISGSLNLNLLEGELLPADSIVLVTYGNFSQEFNLSYLISDEKVSGNFYADGVSLSGEGEGYGLPGKIIEYPTINFKLKIDADKNKGEPESPSTTGGVEEPTVEENIPSTSESPPQSPAETSTESTSSPDESSSITGASISNSEIDGSVSKDNDFTYGLSDRESVNLVPGSVYYNNSALDDNSVKVKSDNGEVIVSTDYSVEREGFGEEYLGKKSKKISFDLDQFNLIADSEGALSISISYQGEKIVEASEEILIQNNPIIKENESITEPIIENATITNQTELNVTEFNTTIINESVVNVNITQFTAVLGQPVKWVKKISLDQLNESLSLVVEIPASAENITIEKIVYDKKMASDNLEENNANQISNSSIVENPETYNVENAILVNDSSSADVVIDITGAVTLGVDLHKETIFSKIFKFFRSTGLVIDGSEKDIQEIYVELNETDLGAEIQYYTDAPTATEEVMSEEYKKVHISSPDDVHYENVLIFTNLSDNLRITDISSINIEWVENNTSLNVYSAKDTNNDSYYDYIEWIAPHLSNQTFNIIVITNAEHLNENRDFISNIYNETRTLDDFWSETISEGHYVRVKFEKNLTNENDITLYPRVVSGDPIIEIYEKDGSNIIDSFDNLNNSQYNKVYLTNLGNKSLDTFDLRIIGGDIQFDHIIDPTFNEPFFDSFEDGVSWTHWTEATGTGWANVNLCPTNCAIGTRCACAESGARDVLQMTNAVDLTSYDDCILNYSRYVDSSFDNGEFYYVNATNSAGVFVNIFSCTNGQACENNAWTYETYNITSGVGLNNNFKIRVSAILNDLNEEAGFDFINITCTTSDASDTTPPIVTINSPQSSNYSKLLDLPLILNVTLNENGDVNYSIDNGLTNYSMQNNGNIDFNATLDSLDFGDYTAKFYAVDTAGNTNYTTNVSFSILQQYALVNGTILDSSGLPINSTITIYNDDIGDYIYNETGENLSSVISLNSTYTIRVYPLDIETIDRIRFDNINLSEQNITDTSINIVKLDELPTLDNLSSVFSVDPLLDNFTNYTLFFIAQSPEMKKCPTWNFTDQSCPGGWEPFLHDLNVGQTYNITLLPGDPAFGFIEITMALHLDENRTILSDIYSTVNALDDIWSETIPDTHYVRVTFEKNLTSVNDITVYPRNISGNPRITVYNSGSSEEIVNFSSLTFNQYNKVYLTNFGTGSSDVFDLGITGGDIQFDHIIDPVTTVVLLANAVANPATNGTHTDTGGFAFQAQSLMTASQITGLNASTGTTFVPGGATAARDTFVYINFTLPAYEKITGIVATTVMNTTIAGHMKGTALFNYTSNKWQRVNTSFGAIGTLNTTLYNLTISANSSSNFVSGNKLALLAYQNSTANGVLGIDYMAINFTYEPVAAPNINLSAPLNGSTVSSQTISFNATFSDNVALRNATLYIWNSSLTLINTTNRSIVGLTDSVNISVVLPYGGVFYWNYLAVDNSSNMAMNSSNFTLTASFDFTPPDINFTSPTTSNGTQNANSIFVNVSVTDLSNTSSFIDFDNSLLAWWRMDDRNSSGGIVSYNGKANGTIVGTISINSTGKLANSSWFNNGGDFIVVDGNVTSYFPYSKMTISSWVYLRVNKDYNPIIYLHNFEAGKCGVQFGGWLLGFVFAPGCDAGSPLLFVSVANTSYSLNTWNHFVGTYNGTAAKLYLNGAEVGSATNTTYDINFTRDVNSIELGGSWAFFNGSLDDLMIFNRSLSATEIAALYANTSSRYYSNNFTNLADNNYTFKVYAQDTFGNVNSTETRTVKIDTIAPLVTINQPQNATLIAPILFNVTTNENTTYVNYTLDNGLINYSMQNNGNINFNATNNTIATGQYTVIFYAWDVAGNLNSTMNRTFVVEGPLLTSCGVLTISGTTYQQGSNIVPNNSTKPCFNITASNITFDGAGFSIRNTTFNNTGIYSLANINITIKNVNISLNSPLSTGINLTSTNYSLIKDSILRANRIGIFIFASSNNNISNINTTNNNLDGVQAIGLINSTLSFINSSSNTDDGIDVSSSINNTFSLIKSYANGDAGFVATTSINVTVLDSLSVSNTLYGFFLSSTNNSLIKNLSLLNGVYGVYIDSSFNDTLRNNNLSGNSIANFYLDGTSNTFYNHDIDASNIVDYAFALYYNFSKSSYTYNVTTAPNAGAVFCIACDKINVTDLNLSHKNRAGIFFYNTTNSKINNISSTGNLNAIRLEFSKNNILTNITSSQSSSSGVYFAYSNNNTLLNTNSSNSVSYALDLEYSINNTIDSFNSISNLYGLFLSGSDFNKITNSSLQGATQSGLYLQGSFNNNFTSVVLNNNTYGLYIFSATNSTFRNITINSSQNNGLFLYYNSLSSNVNNKFINVTILNTNSSFTDLIFFFTGEGIPIYTDYVYFVDSYIGNYSFIDDTGTLTDYGGLLSVENSRYGSVKFISPINGSGNNFTADIQILNNSATVRSDINNMLNRSANVTLKGVRDRNLYNILRNGAPCASGVCNNFTNLNSGNVLFNVTYWTNYSLNYSIPKFYALQAQSCSAMDDSTDPNTYSSSCDGSYPNSCSYDLVSCNDSYYEQQSVTTTTYGGIVAEFYNSSVTDCSAITSVKLCYHWYTLEGTNTFTSCDIYVDSAGGTSYTSLGGICPAATPSSISCVDVTSLEPWSCSNFFGASGTRAKARTEVFNEAEPVNILQEVLTFNVTYSTASNSAPYNGTVVILNSSLGLNRTRENLHVRTTLLDQDNNTMNVTVRWYNNSILYGAFEFNNSYANGSTFIATLAHQNTTKFENWSAQLTLFDGTTSFWVNSSNLTILNTPPNATLLTPSDGSTTINRTSQNFTWASSDDDGDAISAWEITITPSLVSSCTDNTFQGGSAVLGTFNLATDGNGFLNCLIDNGDAYLWKVRVSDGTYGDYSAEYTLNVQAYLNVLLNISSIQFGNLAYLKYNDTTDNSPQPIIIINEGNVLNDIKVHATSIWMSVANPSNYFQFKFDNVSTNNIFENNTFRKSGTNVTYTNVLGSAPSNSSLIDLNFTDSADSVEVDFNVTVPSTEGPGSRNSTITFTISLGTGDTYV